MQKQTPKVDYYEFLQISPNADQDTIHRVYRFLAARFHPDNPKSGNAATFSTLTAAYEVLSDPDRRSEYDAVRERESDRVPPLSTTIDFMDNLEGETNRRLAVLAVLYYRRRTNPQKPEVGLNEIESRMGFPRDYLDFTTWYLMKKGYIMRADNSDFTLTAQGVDYVETQRVNIPMLNKLLTSGAEAGAAAAAETAPAPTTRIVVEEALPTPERFAMNAPVAAVNGTARRQPPGRVALAEERRLKPDRRKSASDRRKNEADRRSKS